MQLIYSPAFLKDYARLAPKLRDQVDKQLTLLAENPRHPSLRVDKRRGEGDTWQARITRSQRLFFRMDGSTITLVALAPHE